MKKTIIALCMLQSSLTAFAQSGLTVQSTYGPGEVPGPVTEVHIAPEVKSPPPLQLENLPSENDNAIAYEEQPASMKEVLQSAPVDPSYQGLTPVEYSDPNLDRYRNSPYYNELGYVPGRDNESSYREREEEDWRKRTFISVLLCLGAALLVVVVSNFLRTRKITIQKKTVAVLLASIGLLQSSCTKSGPSTPGTPPAGPTVTGSSKGFVRISLAGKILEAKDTIVGGEPLIGHRPQIRLSSTPESSTPGVYNKLVQLGTDLAINGNLKMTVMFSKYPSTDNNPLDTYLRAYGAWKLTDKSTATDYAIDTGSTLTVINVTDSFVYGTLNLLLLGSGSGTITAPGEFKIYTK